MRYLLWAILLGSLLLPRFSFATPAFLCTEVLGGGLPHRNLSEYLDFIKEYASKPHTVDEFHRVGIKDNLPMFTSMPAAKLAEQLNREDPNLKLIPTTDVFGVECYQNTIEIPPNTHITITIYPSSATTYAHGAFYQQIREYGLLAEPVMNSFNTYYNFVQRRTQTTIYLGIGPTDAHIVPQLVPYIDHIGKILINNSAETVIALPTDFNATTFNPQSIIMNSVPPK